MRYFTQQKTRKGYPARCGFYHEIHERHERESSNMDGQDVQDSWKELFLLILTIHVIKLSREGAKFFMKFHVFHGFKKLHHGDTKARRRLRRA